MDKFITISLDFWQVPLYLRKIEIEKSTNRYVNLSSKKINLMYIDEKNNVIKCQYDEYTNELDELLNKLITYNNKGRIDITLNFYLDKELLEKIINVLTIKFLYV
jgi:hypothetical protein